MEITILYIEDELIDRIAFERSAKKNALPYKILMASTIDEAFSIVENNNIQCIVTDYNLGHVTALDLINKICDIPIIVITGMGSEETAVNSLKAGAYDYLIKDVQANYLSILPVTIDNVIKRKNAQIELEQYRSQLEEMVQQRTFELVKLNETLQNEIIERKHTEQELIIAKKKAEESDRLKSAFLANISHEIRTPMNGILGFAEMLTSTDTTDDKRPMYVEIINNSCTQLLSIISDLIDISRIESGIMNLQLSSFQLNHLLNEQCLLHNASANHKNNEIKVNYFFSDYDDEIVTDKIKLNQVINNLINNAIKFTSNGQIEIGYKVTDNLLMFWIKDSGIGIAPEHLKVIFERFRQVETEFNRMYGGTGLGLSISKAYVEFMGGNIWVESELDKGSNFYFTIPLIQNNIDNKTSIQSSAKNYPNLTGNIILIAEDEDMNYYFLRELLEVCNATILRAENGREAIEICKNQKVDLVLMDIKMPDLNGLEASSIIKTSIKPDIHIIAQTAYAYDEDKDKAKINFCDGYITKPINKTELYELLNKFLVTGMPKI